MSSFMISQRKQETQPEETSFVQNNASVIRAYESLADLEQMDQIHPQEQKRNILSHKGSITWLRKRYKERGNLNYLWRKRNYFLKEDLDELFQSVQDRCSSECKQQGCIQSEQLFQYIKESNPIDKKAFTEIINLVDRENTGKLKKDQFETLLLSKTIQQFFSQEENSYHLTSPFLTPEQRKNKEPDQLLDFSRLIGKSKYQRDRNKLISNFQQIRNDKDIDIYSKYDHLNKLIIQKNFNVSNIGVSPLQHKIAPKFKTTRQSSVMTPFTVERSRRDSLSSNLVEEIDSLGVSTLSRKFTKTPQMNNRQNSKIEGLKESQQNILDTLSWIDQESRPTSNDRSKKNQSVDQKEPYHSELLLLVGRAKQKGKQQAELLPTDQITKQTSNRAIKIIQSQRKIQSPIKMKDNYYTLPIDNNTNNSRIQVNINDSIKKHTSLSPLKKYNSPLKGRNPSLEAAPYTNSIKFTWQDSFSGIFNRKKSTESISSPLQVRKYQSDTQHFMTEFY